jgi:hypothetical protein
MARIEPGWVRNAGTPTTIFTLILAGPWCLIPFIGLRFLLVDLSILPPIWWWLVRGRTDEPLRGAMASLVIGPRVHLDESMLLVCTARGPGRGDGDQWRRLRLRLLQGGFTCVLARGAPEFRGLSYEATAPFACLSRCAKIAR